MPRTPEELASLLSEQVHFLRASSSAYDMGVVAEAKRIATTISTLLHSNHKRTSVALLQQMRVRDDISYLSFAHPLSNHYPKLNLAVLHFDLEKGAKFLPKCSASFFEDEPRRWVTFKDWWTGEEIYQVTIESGKVCTLNRHDLTRMLRSKDGGSHVDEDLKDETYERLLRNADTGVYVFSKGIEAGVLTEPEDGAVPVHGGHLASMRQMAFELDQSLIRAGLVQPQ